MVRAIRAASSHLALQLLRCSLGEGVVERLLVARQP